MTDVLTMPGVQTLHFPVLTTQQKVAWIEDMAGVTGLTVGMTLCLLSRVHHGSLAGDDLWDAWNAAENAIACRNATKVSDADYEGYEDRAADRIHDLIHGTGPARGSRTTPTGDYAS